MSNFENLKVQYFELLYSFFKRLSKAIHCVEEPIDIDTENLNKVALGILAEKTQHSFFHYSGNCSLLALVFHFNLKAKKLFLTVSNTQPFFIGLNERSILMLLFNQSKFSSQESVIGLQACEETILKNYREKGEQFFIVQTDGHSFNAVVFIDELHEPQVQYVDVWKTSNQTPSQAELRNRFSDDIRLNISTINDNFDFKSVVNTLKNPLSFNPSISLKLFKQTYLCHYQQSFFKNPWSNMKQSLESNSVESMDDVFNYAQNNPTSRTAEVITNLNLGFVGV